MSVDTWCVQLDPDDVFATFTSRLIRFLGEYLAPTAMKLENIQMEYSRLRQFAPCLEDVSEVVLGSDQIQSHALRIGELIGIAKGAHQEALKRMAVDILVFASLAPCTLVSAPQHYYSLFQYKVAFSRNAIRPISPLLAEGLLRDLLGSLTYNHQGEAVVHLKDLPLLGHIDVQAYMTANLEKRMFWLSLAHLSMPLRQDLLQEEKPTQILSRRIYNSTHLSYWMLACSDAEEQFFLNTCDIAASLSSIVSFHSTIASLIQLGRIISADVERRMPLSSNSDPAYPVWWGAAPSQYSFVKLVVDEFNKDMSALEDQISTILDNETNLPLAPLDVHDSPAYIQTRSVDRINGYKEPLLLERRELTKKWHKSMQRLSSVFFPENPVVLTDKVFPNDWHKSAKWMTARALIEQFLPSKPSFLSRSQASRSLEQISCHYHHTILALMEPDADKGLWIDFPWNLSEMSNKSKRIALIERLWHRIAFYDGVLVSSREHLFFGYWTIGHLSYWKAVKLGLSENDRYFLISDPELHYFKVLSMEQVADYVSDIKNLVNPTDGAAVQHYRAQRLQST